MSVPAGNKKNASCDGFQRRGILAGHIWVLDVLCSMNSSRFMNDNTVLLQGDAQLDVWSEVVPPFHLMPRFMLESTSNAVMGALVSNLLPRFMER